MPKDILIYKYGLKNSVAKACVQERGGRGEGNGVDMFNGENGGICNTFNNEYREYLVLETRRKSKETKKRDQNNKSEVKSLYDFQSQLKKAFNIRG